MYSVVVTATQQKSSVFSAWFDLNPVTFDTDYALDISVQPIEVVYDEVSVIAVR